MLQNISETNLRPPSQKPPCPSVDAQVSFADHQSVVNGFTTLGLSAGAAVLEYWALARGQRYTPAQIQQVTSPPQSAPATCWQADMTGGYAASMSLARCGNSSALSSSSPAAVASPSTSSAGQWFVIVPVSNALSDHPAGRRRSLLQGGGNDSSSDCGYSSGNSYLLYIYNPAVPAFNPAASPPLCVDNRQPCRAV